MAESGASAREARVLHVGAYDPDAWAGLVFSDAPGRGFAFRLAVEREGERADREELFFLVHEVGAHAPDETYACVAFDTTLPFGRGPDTPVVRRRLGKAGLTLEWSRLTGGRAVARMALGFAGFLELRGYFPWDWTGSWAIDGESLVAVSADGEASFALVIGGERPTQGYVEPTGEATLRLEVRSGDRIHLGCALAGTREEALREAREALSQADTAIDSAAMAYEASRVTVAGAWDGLAASITNNLHWMVLLQPEKGRLYTPAGRQWIFPSPAGPRDHWTVFEWDSFLNALELAVESPELAREAVIAVLETQYENGNIPNWRGRFGGSPDRSQPPVGSFAVLKLYGRTRDRSLLKLALPHLERWSAWWRADKGGRPRRDGNANGLFEWGCDVEFLRRWTPPWEKDTTSHQRAGWESGQDDLPAWEEARFVPEIETFDLESVDLNSLLALDDECLAHIAEELGEREKAAAYRARCEDLRLKINERLWDEERGMYGDRSWDGRRSPRRAAGHFFPLLAGVPDAARAVRMVESLRDESLFWGRFVLPTISRDDPAFPDQQYWRGSIWPPTNYLVCQGLRRYGFDEIAGQLAARSVDLFLGTWREFQLCRENYDSRTGAGGGQRHQSWGPLLALMGVEEFLDVTPWEGLRIGSLTPPEGATLNRLRCRGHAWSVSLSPAGLTVNVDGSDVLRSDAPVVLRQCRLTPNGLEAEAHCVQPVQIQFGRGQSVHLSPRRSALVPG